MAHFQVYLGQLWCCNKHQEMLAPSPSFLFHVLLFRDFRFHSVGENAFQNKQPLNMFRLFNRDVTKTMWHNAKEQSAAFKAKAKNLDLRPKPNIYAVQP